MQRTRRLAQFLALLLVAITIFSILPMSAEEAAIPSTEEATAVYFYHLESESVISQKNADTVINAGSTAKIMAGLIFCEQLAHRTADTVYITDEMVASAAGYRIKLTSGDILTVEQLLYAALCSSYNDAYDALACFVGGTKATFVEMMNTRAKELGAKHTTFTDASGIDDSSLTTARDMAKIARAASQNELYMRITSTTRYEFLATDKLERRTIHNRNALIASNTTTLYYNGKCRGLNAGYTDRAGSCVVTVATNGRESYLCIVMGAPDTETENFGYTVANRLINWVYNTYTYMEVISPDDVVCKIPVTVSDLTSEVEVKAHESLSCYLPTGSEIGKDIIYSIRLTHTTLEAPVTEGEHVGYVAILWNGKTLGTVPLYTAGTAERSSFVSSLKSIQSLTQSRVFRASAIFFAVSLAAWITVECILVRYRRHKWDKYFSMKMAPTPDAFKKKN